MADHGTMTVEEATELMRLYNRDASERLRAFRDWGCFRPQRLITKDDVLGITEAARVLGTTVHV